MYFSWHNMYNALISSQLKIPFCYKSICKRNVFFTLIAVLFFYRKGHKGKHKARKVLIN